jgi:hypothetical protein
MLAATQPVAEAPKAQRAIGKLVVALLSLSIGGLATSFAVLTLFLVLTAWVFAAGSLLATISDAGVLADVRMLLFVPPMQSFITILASGAIGIPLFLALTDAAWACFLVSKTRQLRSRRMRIMRDVPQSR